MPTNAGLIETTTADSFDIAVLAADGPAVVEFMSYGCSHCRTIEPILEQVAKKLATSERIFRVNVGVDQDLAREYGVEGTPTFVMFLNGQEMGRSEGPNPSFASLMGAVTAPFAA